MTKILVSGLISIETTLQIERFPVEYAPVEYPFFSINTNVAGVGYTITRALTRLGNRVNLLSIIGQDLAAQPVRDALERDYIDSQYVVAAAAQTAQAVILLDPQARQKIHVDLKDIQKLFYPASSFERAMSGCDWAVLCNINFSRPFLKPARQAGKRIVTDVHTISDLEDAYNKDFLESASIIFMSDELLPMPPEAWAAEVMKRYSPELVVIGLGEEGALLSYRKDNFIGRFPAVFTRPLVSTVGAGDALLAGFLHCYLEGGNPYEAIQKALVFVSYKLGAVSASSGFLDSHRLDKLYEEVSKRVQAGEKQKGG